MVNKHIVDYHPSPSEFTSRIRPLIFLWTSKGFIPAEYFLNFFSNLHIPPWQQKNFKFMVLRLLKNTFLSQKNESVYSWPRAKLSPRFLSSPLQAKGNYPFPPNKVSFSSVQRARTIQLKVRPKLNLQGYWSRDLINSTIYCLYIFGFCLVVPYFRFKQAEV